MSTLTESPAWQALVSHKQAIHSLDLRAEFRSDPDRAERFSIEAVGIFLDYSKNLITKETLLHLMTLAEQQQLEVWRQRMFQGEAINTTEHRAVLHTALRNCSDQPVYHAGQDVMPDVRGVLARMKSFCHTVHSHEWRGYTGQPIDTIVSIGIGGSYLGPKMAYSALKSFAVPGICTYFVSNVDANDLQDVLQNCNPETTLFVIASKTFTTQETMLNADAAKAWFLACSRDPKHLAKHFVAVSANREGAAAYGIDEACVFEFWDWVGGRYSLWSAIGLPLALSIGVPHFEQLLEGAYAMDQHFMSTPLAQNMPVIMALLGVWYHNFCGASSHVVLPYNQHLQFLPEYLQQQDMESNGKSIDRDGHTVDYTTGPVIWGSLGSNAQHAYYQLIHQGTQLIPSDLILAIPSESEHSEQQVALAANFIAQSEALMRGKNIDEVRREMEPDVDEALVPHKVFAGNRPSNTLLLDTLNPKTLGALIALYEHKVFVQGVIWNINSFDQWGVELGKQLGKTILKTLTDTSNGQGHSHDSSTKALIQRLINRK